MPELEALKAAARQRLAGGQAELDLGLGAAIGTGGQAVASRPSARPLEIASSRMGHLWDALCRAYDALGFDQAAGGDEVFRQLVLARIIEPTSKLDSLRVLAEVGVDAAVVSHAQAPPAGYATDGFRRKLAAACAAHARLGPASLVLYDVSRSTSRPTPGDGFREPGFSKERRLEPQITIGLLTDAAGFPLMVEAFEGNTAETTTMLPDDHARSWPPTSSPTSPSSPTPGMISDGQQAGDRGRRAVVHPRREDPRHPLRRGRSGGASIPTRRSPTG